MDEKQSLVPEAVASITYTVKTGSGFPGLLTIRDSSVEGLFNQMFLAELEFDKHNITPGKNRGGFTPFPKKQPEQQIVAGATCPKCGSDVVMGVTKNGKKFTACSKRKYNMATKQVDGCDYIAWEDSLASKPQYPTQQPIGAQQPIAQQPVGDVKPPSGPQVALVRKLQSEGKIDMQLNPFDLSFDDVRDLISSVTKK